MGRIWESNMGSELEGKDSDFSWKLGWSIISILFIHGSILSVFFIGKHEKGQIAKKPNSVTCGKVDTL
jgi:hypothetical protein